MIYFKNLWVKTIYPHVLLQILHCWDKISDIKGKCLLVLAFQNCQSMVSQLQGRNITAEGAAEAKMLSSKLQGSSLPARKKQGTNRHVSQSHTYTINPNKSIRAIYSLKPITLSTESNHQIIHLKTSRCTAFSASGFYTKF